MRDTIKKVIAPSEDDKYKKYLEKFRRKHIPARYNQVKLLNELNNPNIDHYISISNRTDGKSFNYLHTLLNIAIEYDLGLTLISRNMRLRTSYQVLLENVINESSIFEIDDFVFIRQQYYIKISYKKKDIAIITDLNQATELKYYSNYIKDFPIMVYDEFLAIEGDYLYDEWIRLKTIYESIDRKKSHRLIHKPKIFYLGNAVNFSSPVLSELDLFNKIENHPINTMQVYGNVAIEINRNDSANDERNTRAFNSDNDAMTTAQFEINKHNIATEDEVRGINKNRQRITIKLHDGYILIDYNRDSYKTLLSVVGYTEGDYDYNARLEDNTAHSVYLDDRYYKQNETKRHDKGLYLYNNQYTKEQVTAGGQGLVNLDIRKIIRESEQNLQKVRTEDIRDEQYERNYYEDSLKRLTRKFFG